MKSIIAIIFLTLSCWVSPTCATFVIDPIPVPDTDCAAPAVSSSDDGLTMVSFTASGVVTQSFIVTQLLPTHPDPAIPWPDPVTITAGSSSSLCWSRDGFTLAVVSGPMILLFQSDLEGTWDLDNYTMLNPGGEVFSLDLWGVPSDAAGPAVFLTWQSSQIPPDYGGDVYFASRSGLGWSAPQLVAEVTGSISPHPWVASSMWSVPSFCPGKSWVWVPSPPVLAAPCTTR